MLFLMMANLGQVLKKQVSGFDFKKPGYPGRVLGFQNCTNLANLDWKIGTFCQITKLVLFISPKYGNFKLFSEFLNILPQSVRQASCLVYLKSLIKIIRFVFCEKIHEFCLPKLMIFYEYLSILRPHNLENRKTGYPGFDSEKPDPFKWEKPGF